MLDILWFFLIIYLSILGIRFAKIINYKNFSIKTMFKDLNYDSLFLALGTKMGVGTIIGTTMSIYIGGPGSILWIYIFTLLTSSIIYVESYLGSKYRQKLNNEYVGGIYYYTKFGLKNKTLAIISLIIFVSCYSFFFLMIQSNTVLDILNINKYILSIILLILLIILITNETTQISKILNKIVPVMCTFFIVISIISIFKNTELIPTILKSIITSAFNPKTFLTGMIIGIKRSIFLNELLIGTTSMSSGINASISENTAKTLTIGTYFITFIVSTLIAFLILIYMHYNPTIPASYNDLLKNVFIFHFPKFGLFFLALIISLLATTTIISGIYIGTSNINYITNNKIIKFIFKSLIVMCIILGLFISTDKIWYLIDTMMLIIIILNSFIVNKLKNDVNNN